ncbi:quinolinate synthase NadA [Metabacillus sp. RGM 3146]|uniref:quinolinate synthase NadA n=1 Tax=Metabacillus sp. RGM 3146 TaxID=3401092 RepID=UPI003B9BB220
MSLLQTLKNDQMRMIPEKYKSIPVSEMEERIREIKNKFGEKLLIPGHHYQKDEIIQFADITGDSLQLAQASAENRKAEHIVFCGVHFMAETADMLTANHQKVYLPDMRAGCSMADMADIKQTERAWEKLQKIFGDTIIPLTYVNSTAAIKAFVGKNGGATVTSSNAKEIVKWALSQKERILFLPDQHLGRNTAFDLDISLEKMAVWDQNTEKLEYEGEDNLKVLLWKGHCSVHEKFTVKNIEYIRTSKPDMSILVHPECTHEVVVKSDYAGSTKYIIDMLEKAPAGSKWAIGTEMNLVNRLIQAHPDKEVISLNPYMCPCLTMNRIDLAHLLWSLEELDQNGTGVNQIIVGEDVTRNAVKALDRMLSIR